jgi:magnesium transporter
MFEIYYKSDRAQEFEQISDFRPGSWVYVKNTKHEDLVKISELTGVDIADIRDSLDRFELPRIERVDDHTLLFIRHPSDTEYGLYTDTLTILLTPNFVFTISPDRSESVEHVLATSTAFSTPQKAKLLLSILLRVTQDYTGNIKRLRHSILENERKIKEIDTFAISHLTKNEEILNQYLTALIPMRNTLKAMSEGKFLPLFEEDTDLLQDLMIAIQQSEDVCAVNIKSIRSLRDSYQIIFTNNVNKTIKLLTALTIVFHIPTITASLYGMNVALPYQTAPGAFWYVMLLIVVLSFVVIVLFRRNRWL